MKRILKWISIGFVVLFAVGLIIDKEPKTGATHSVNNSESEQVVTPPLSVTANELLQAYKANTVAANLKYKEKRLLVNAKIDSIKADYRDRPYLVLAAGGQYEFSQPQAHMTTGTDEQIGLLKKGQSIQLLCIGNSDMMGSPMLKECSIQ